MENPLTGSKPIETAVAPEPKPIVEPVANVEPQVAPDAAPDKTISDAEKARREAQSQKDAQQYQNELQQAKARLEVLEQRFGKYGEFVSLLESDDGFLDHTRRFFQPEQPAADTGPPLPDKPVPPEIPYWYNPQDALSDPESKSAEVYRQIEKYREDKLSWMETVMLRQEQERETQRAQARQTQQQQRYLDEVSRRAKVFGVEDPADYRRFLDGITPEQEEKIYAFWYLNRGKPSAEELFTQKRQAELSRQAEAANVSPPAAAAPTGGENEPPEQGIFVRKTVGGTLT